MIGLDSMTITRARTLGLLEFVEKRDSKICIGDQACRAGQKPVSGTAPSTTYSTYIGTLYACKHAMGILHTTLRSNYLRKRGAGQDRDDDGGGNIEMREPSATKDRRNPSQESNKGLV